MSIHVSMNVVDPCPRYAGILYMCVDTIYMSPVHTSRCNTAAYSIASINTDLNGKKLHDSVQNVIT